MTATIENVWTALERSGLLGADQLGAVRSELPPTDDPRRLALELIRRDLLTRWQAQHLLSPDQRLVLGKYRLLDQIVAGAMGTVYKAQKPGGRVFALKLINPDKLNTPSVVERFLREIRAVAVLDHPNIIQAFDAESTGDTHFLVMEYVQGRTLADWIAQYESLPIDWSCE